ncbi:MAG: hypothetical protein LUG23_06290 [Oscillospiraceae bacterium]|nr:hypothetical protein [Oscillospiraceae bacterium]
MNETTNSLNDEDINVTTTDSTPVATHDEEQITTNQQFNYDPYTGKPLYKYDPFTGQPLTGNEQSQQFQQVINENGQVSYTTITSDKSWKKAVHLSLWGLGLHHFYVGRVGWGIFGFLKGLLTWMTGTFFIFYPLIAISDASSFSFATYGEYFARTIIYYLLFNDVSFIQLATKTYRDASGAPLRK